MSLNFLLFQKEIYSEFIQINLKIGQKNSSSISENLNCGHHSCISVLLKFLTALIIVDLEHTLSTIILYILII